MLANVLVCCFIYGVVSLFQVLPSAARAVLGELSRLQVGLVRARHVRGLIPCVVVLCVG
jgi:hypothetical protein